MNQELLQALAQLKEKVKTLVQHNEQLAKANGKLESTCNQLKSDLAAKDGTLEKMETELRAKQASNAMQVDNQKIEKDIDKYIKLIDNSIASIQKDL